MKVFFSLVFISHLLVSFSFASMKYNPVGELSVYGGKYYLDGDSSSTDLKLDAFFSPSLILDEKK